MLRIRLTAVLVMLFTLALSLPVYAQDALPLTETYTTKDGAFTFNYPVGWVMRELVGSYITLDVDIGTSEDVLRQDPLNDTSAMIQPGEAAVHVLLMSKINLAYLAGAESTSDIASITQAMLDRGSSPATIDSVHTATIHDLPAASYTFHAGQRGEGITTLIDFGGQIGWLTVDTASGELPQWQPTVDAMIASLNVKPTSERIPEGLPGAALELPWIFTTRDQTASVQYPADWVYKDQQTPNYLLGVTFGNNLPTLDRPLNGSEGNLYQPGDIQVKVFVTDVEHLAGNSPGITAATTSREILESITQTASLAVGVHIGEIETTTIGDWAGAQVHYNAGKNGDALILVLQLREGVWLIGSVLTASGDMPRWEATARAMIASVQLKLPEVTPEATP